MSRPLLIIGNRNYSSWSLRAWLALAHGGVEFDLRRLALFTPEWHAQRHRWTPAGRVPVLEHDGLRVWDSLAICEYAAEALPGAVGWPHGLRDRARARSVVAEMHSGYAALRERAPMNCRRAPGGFVADDEVRADVERIEGLWRECLAASGGPWLFGDFSLADVFHAPVAVRLTGYGIAVDDGARGYAARLLDTPAMRAWIDEARREPEIIADAER